METMITEKIEWAEEAARHDPQYQQLLRENKVLEKRFDQMIRRLSDEERGIAWDYVMNCEDMSRRLLELACGK